MWNKTTYPFLNLNGVTVDDWELISNFNPHFTGMWLLIHNSERGLYKKCLAKYENGLWDQITYLCIFYAKSHQSKSINNKSFRFPIIFEKIMLEKSAAYAIYISFNNFILKQMV